MNDEPTPPPPPAPDPFESIAQTLANCAAMLVQLAGQVATLKQAQQQPTQPPPPEPEPENEEKEEQPADESKTEPEPEPETEPEQPEEAQEPVPESPQEEPTEQEQSWPEPPAESPANEQDEQPEEQPEPDELDESEQDSEGGELDNPPDVPAEEKPAEDSEGEGEPTDEAEAEEQPQDGQPNDSDSGEGDDADDADDADGTNENGDADSEGEDAEPAEAADDEAGAGSGKTGEPSEAESTDKTEGADEPEHVEEEPQMSAEGDGESEQDPDAEGEGNTPAANDGKGTAAALPPDLPPLDSTLARCSPPPPPDSIPYRPLSPVAKKCADILTAALGKRFSLPRSDRHTGQLSANAVARHAPDVFRRRPSRDGKRPRLTFIVDTSGSMGEVHQKYGQHLIDGLLEAHRRKVIELRLYDSYLCTGAGRASKAHCEGRAIEHGTGLFIESKARALIEAGNAPIGTVTPDDLAKAQHLKVYGAVPGSFGSEGFARTLKNLTPVILDSDATVIFTDGHWTDGALDKVEYQMAGIQVVGLYIAPEIEEVQNLLQRCRNAAKEAERRGKTAPAEALREAEKAFSELAFHASVTGKLAMQEFATRIRLDEAIDEARKSVDTSETDALSRAVDQLASESKKLNVENAPAIRAALAAIEKARVMLCSFGDIPVNLGYILDEKAHKRANAAAALELNSHHSYCTGNATEAAQVIVQEITRQLSSK